MTTEFYKNFKVHGEFCSHLYSERDTIRILQEFLLEISRRPQNSKAADLTYRIEESTDADVCK